MVFTELKKSDGPHTRRRNASDANLDMEPEMSLSTHSTIVESAPALTMSIYYLVMLNAIVCGLEFCASAGFCYIPPMLLKAGMRFDKTWLKYIHKFHIYKGGGEN